MNQWLRVHKKLVCGIIGLALVFTALGIIYHHVGRPYTGEKVRLYIPPHATARQVQDTLRQHLGDDYAASLMPYIDLDYPDRMAGSYVVEPGQRSLSIARRINQGVQTPVRYTFNNIRLMSDLAARTAQKLLLDSASFMRGLDSLFAPMGYRPEQYPALVMPNTYEVYWTSSPTEMLQKLYDERQRFWNKKRRSQAEALGLTPEQVCIVASIIEEETHNRKEQPTIARVYLNRLKTGMPLQACPTVKYACGDFKARRITRDMMEKDSPYNTYKVDSLPPGPIRVPEGKTIDIVLTAPEHPYLYFCARPDGSGLHYFSRTYAEQEANARRYHQHLDQRGIRH